MDDIAQPLLEFIKTNQNWAVAVVAFAAFGESLAFVSLLFPGTMLLIAAGTLMRAGAVPYESMIAGAIFGAILGDFASYWIGRKLGGRVAAIWPFSRNPEMLPAGILFFERHGRKSVFIGRFFGPLRAVVTLAAGIMRMPQGQFALANIASAVIWAPMLLFIGDAFGEVGRRTLGSENTVLLVIAGMMLLGVIGAVWAAVRAARSKG